MAATLPAVLALEAALTLDDPAGRWLDAGQNADITLRGDGANPSGSNLEAARAARAEAISGGTGTFDPSNPRNGRNDPSSASSTSSARSSGGCTR